MKRLIRGVKRGNKPPRCPKAWCRNALALDTLEPLTWGAAPRKVWVCRACGYRDDRPAALR